MKTSSLHQHVLVHLPVAPISASWHHPHYMLQFLTVTSYMMAAELQCSTIYSTFRLGTFLDQLYDFNDQLPTSASLISSLYVILRHVLLWIWSDDSLCIFNPFILVYILDPLLYLICRHALSSLSMGMPTLDNNFLSNLFHWLGGLKYCELLSGLLHDSFYTLNTFRPSCTPSNLIY